MTVEERQPRQRRSGLRGAAHPSVPLQFLDVAEGG